MEEKTLFPFLKAEFCSFETYDSSLESQHERAHKLAAEVASHCALYKAGKREGRLERINVLLSSYSSDLHNHLRLEEEGVLSLVNAMTPQQTCKFSELLNPGGCGSQSNNSSSGGCCGSKQASNCGSQRNACGTQQKCGSNCC
jgi:hypothetical protein